MKRISKKLAVLLFAGFLLSNISSIAQIDAGVNFIVAPAEGSTLILNNNYTVTIRIQNYGGTTLSNVPVKFSLNGPGNTPLNEIYPGPLNAGDSAEYTFVSQFTLTDTTDPVGYGIADINGDVFPPNNFKNATYIFPAPPTGYDDEENNIKSNTSLIIEPLIYNPSSESLTVVIENNTGNRAISISLMSLSGKKLMAYNYQAKRPILRSGLDVSNLPSGVYIVVAKNSEGISCKKFVK